MFIKMDSWQIIPVSPVPVRNTWTLWQIIPNLLGSYTAPKTVYPTGLPNVAVVLRLVTVTPWQVSLPG